MDHDTAELSRERAASSEPCSTRPKPFDDNESSSRKRQRTSRGGSRSRSVDNVRPSHVTQDSMAVEEESVKSDPDDAPPQTPTPSSSELPRPEPTSSRVTINLRTSRPLDSIPSNPPSPTTPSRMINGGEDSSTRISVEESGSDELLTIPAIETPTSSPSALGSPEIEVVPVHDDDDFAPPSPPVAIITEDDVLVDYVLQFPYYAHGETLLQTAEKVARFMQYEPIDDDGFFVKLRDWIDTYLTSTEPYPETWYESWDNYRDFWKAFPNIISSMSWRSRFFNRWLEYHRPSHRTLSEFLIQFSRLAGRFVAIDAMTLDKLGENDEEPELPSNSYVRVYCHLVRKQDPSHIGRNLETHYQWEWDREWPAMVESFQLGGGTVSNFAQLVKGLVRLTSRNPKMIENLADPCHMVHYSIAENMRVLRGSSRTHQSFHTEAREHAELGYEFYQALAPGLASIIEKQVTFLTKDTAMAILDTCTFLLREALHFDANGSRSLFEKTRQENPQLYQDTLPVVISLEWKFTMLTRLIMSTQMQLRVVGVGAMCVDLLRIFTDYKEFDPPRNAFLLHFAHFILKNKIIEYLVGIGSHPEIINESNNILGFLVVTKTYEEPQVATIWQTVSNSQDPRVVEAVLRMQRKCFNLQDYSALISLCEKVNSLPIDAFTPVLREFCEMLFREILNKSASPGRLVIDPPPYDLCVRLIRDSSKITPESPGGCLELQSFAAARFRDLLQRGPHSTTRDEIYLNCIGDISAQAATAPGSICVINALVQQNIATDLKRLTTEHGLTQLLVQELESALTLDYQPTNSNLKDGPTTLARRELLHNIIRWEPGTITPSLGARLWNLLVGSEAKSHTARDTWWRMLNSAMKNSSADNVFLAACFKDYLPTLPADCFTIGTLEFVRYAIWNWLAQVQHSFVEDNEIFECPGLDQLWRMILKAPPNTVDAPAIALMVEVYVDSPLIVSLPRANARDIHLALVDRCLKQLAAAATKLKSSSYGLDSRQSGDDMILDVSKADFQNEETIFARSLAVLREFLRAYQSKPKFATPKPRPAHTFAPSTLEGDPLTVKYQSFDGNTQTEVKTLTLGKLNPPASLFASLQEATGFKNYKVYCGGREFDPNQVSVCKSLEDLNLNGLVLVQRREDADSTGQGSGKPTLEAEITKHFDELWGYLGMHETVAHEIYVFLISFPAYERLQQDFDSDTVSYSDMFPPLEPYKSLYAVYALREHVSIHSQKGDVSNGTALAKAISTIVCAISDEKTLASCLNDLLRDTLTVHLVNYLIDLLKAPVLPVNVEDFLTDELLSRLLKIQHLSMSAAPAPNSVSLISKCFEAILEASLQNPKLWSSFKAHMSQTPLLEELLLADSRATIRKTVAKQIANKCTFTPSLSKVSVAEFSASFWPLLSELISKAVQRSNQCEEFFALCKSVFKSLAEVSLDALDLESLVKYWVSLLLDHTTNELINVPESVDHVVYGLTALCLCAVEFAQAYQLTFSRNNIAAELFQKHLFPKLLQNTDADYQTATPKLPLMHLKTRRMINETIFCLVKDDLNQYKKMLGMLDNLLPYSNRGGRENPYGFDLPYSFERERMIRSRTGYVGLKNLSNTCYLNSLFTQLFMNIPFREFMLTAHVADSEVAQKLLHETQILFSYLQNSVKRYVSPEAVANSIRTYDETNIDVSIQMDVDEFYNLLFDRWEGQMLAPEAKKKFKAFYGGQLVQQVKSKECPHISERLEPFSAIQCDIKGKSTLEESLQAYVDGEIMEGDNKYKCSTCDRHVDAVKRACLKDVPDNLIFHLKRFDYNLLRQQRSKINDFFSFPPTIDMRPYKIEHFSGATDESQEDVFELVGVLVHSGTAESGHYYSFIRERPSSSERANWVEFNDDIVSSWDPSNMEHNCFGGLDLQTSSGNLCGDKSYSAYMLFYQRSSSLAVQKEELERSGVPSPRKLPVPQNIGNHITMENEILMRKYCLYDPHHAQFVSKMLLNIKNMNKGQCSELHTLEKAALLPALNLIDQVVSRAKDIPDFISSMAQVKKICTSCAECSRDFLEWLCDRQHAMRNLLLRNTDMLVRNETASMIITALVKVKSDIPYAYGLGVSDDDSSDTMESDEPRLIYRVIESVNLLWEEFHQVCRSWPEYFGLLYSIAKLGDQEAALLLDCGYLRKALEVISADANLTSSLQYTRMLNNISKRGTNRPVSYDAVMNLAFSLIEVCDLEAPPVRDEYNHRIDFAAEDSGPIPVTKSERDLLVQHWMRGSAHILTEKLLLLNQNPTTTKNILTTLLHTKTLNDTLDFNIYQAITHGISKPSSSVPCVPFLRAAITYCEQSERPNAITRMVTQVAKSANQPENNEGREFLLFFRDILQLQEDSNATEMTNEDIRKLVIGLTPTFAPSLLLEYEFNVRENTERLVSDILFKRSPREESSSDDGEELPDYQVDAARKLGFQCLQHLQDTYIHPRQTAVRVQLEHIFRMIDACAAYFDAEEDKNCAFFTKRAAVIPALKKLTVEEAEEEVTDWTDGEYESEPMDGITDVIGEELDTSV